MWINVCISVLTPAVLQLQVLELLPANGVATGNLGKNGRNGIVREPSTQVSGLLKFIGSVRLEKLSRSAKSNL